MSQKLLHDEKSHKFIVQSDGFTSELKYEIEDNQINMYSTYVPPEGRGQGIAVFIERNSQYQDLLKATS